MATRPTKNNKLATNMNQSPQNMFWSSCSWIIKITMKILPWLMLMHNLLYVIFPSSRNGNGLAWSNVLSIVYLIAMQAAIEAGLIEV
ncbi:hypothetical protein KCU81_g8945, partial [Aureobasidium melanogenum]